MPRNRFEGARIETLINIRANDQASDDLARVANEVGDIDERLDEATRSAERLNQEFDEMSQNQRTADNILHNTNPDLVNTSFRQYGDALYGLSQEPTSSTFAGNQRQAVNDINQRFDQFTRELLQEKTKEIINQLNTLGEEAEPSLVQDINRLKQRLERLLSQEFDEIGDNTERQFQIAGSQFNAITDRGPIPASFDNAAIRTERLLQDNYAISKLYNENVDRVYAAQRIDPIPTTATSGAAGGAPPRQPPTSPPTTPPADDPNSFFRQAGRNTREAASYAYRQGIETAENVFYGRGPAYSSFQPVNTTYDRFQSRGGLIGNVQGFIRRGGFAGPTHLIGGTGGFDGGPGGGGGGGSGGGVGTPGNVHPVFGNIGTGQRGLLGLGTLLGSITDQSSTFGAGLGIAGGLLQGSAGVFDPYIWIGALQTIAFSMRTLIESGRELSQLERSYRNISASILGPGGAATAADTLDTNLSQVTTRGERDRLGLQLLSTGIATTVTEQSDYIEVLSGLATATGQDRESAINRFISIYANRELKGLNDFAINRQEVSREIRRLIDSEDITYAEAYPQALSNVARETYESLGGIGLYDEATIQGNYAAQSGDNLARTVHSVFEAISRGLSSIFDRAAFLEREAARARAADPAFNETVIDIAREYDFTPSALSSSDNPFSTSSVRQAQQDTQFQELDALNEVVRESLQAGLTPRIGDPNDAPTDPRLLAALDRLFNYDVTRSEAPELLEAVRQLANLTLTQIGGGEVQARGFTDETFGDFSSAYLAALEIQTRQSEAIAQQQEAFGDRINRFVETGIIPQELRDRTNIFGTRLEPRLDNITQGLLDETRNPRVSRERALSIVHQIEQREGTGQILFGGGLTSELIPEINDQAFADFAEAYLRSVYDERLRELQIAEARLFTNLSVSSPGLSDTFAGLAREREAYERRGFIPESAEETFELRVADFGQDTIRAINDELERQLEALSDDPYAQGVTQEAYDAQISVISKFVREVEALVETLANVRTVSFNQLIASTADQNTDAARERRQVQEANRAFGVDYDDDSANEAFVTELQPYIRSIAEFQGDNEAQAAVRDALEFIRARQDNPVLIPADNLRDPYEAEGLLYQTPVELERVIDGDSFVFRVEGSDQPLEVRASGIDTPEYDTPAGAIATQAAEDILGNAENISISFDPSQFATGIHDRPIVNINVDGNDYSGIIIGEGLSDFSYGPDSPYHEPNSVLYEERLAAQTNRPTQTVEEYFEQRAFALELGAQERNSTIHQIIATTQRLEDAADRGDAAEAAYLQEFLDSLIDTYDSEAEDDPALRESTRFEAQAAHIERARAASEDILPRIRDDENLAEFNRLSREIQDTAGTGRSTQAVEELRQEAIDLYSIIEEIEATNPGLAFERGLGPLKDFADELRDITDERLIELEIVATRRGSLAGAYELEGSSAASELIEKLAEAIPGVGNRENFLREAGYALGTGNRDLDELVNPEGETGRLLAEVIRTLPESDSAQIIVDFFRARSLDSNASFSDEGIIQALFRREGLQFNDVENPDRFTVPYRDSFHDFARRNDLTYRRLQELNPDVDFGSFQSGDRISLIVERGTQPRQDGTQLRPNRLADYTVERNLGLLDIARITGTDPERLLELNPQLGQDNFFTSGGPLGGQTGQIYNRYVPEGFSLQLEGGTVGQARDPNQQFTRRGTQPEYTVRPGDTLSQIARALGTTVDQLYADNPNLPDDPRQLQVGTQINQAAQGVSTVSPDAFVQQPAPEIDLELDDIVLPDINADLAEITTERMEVIADTVNLVTGRDDGEPKPAPAPTPGPTPGAEPRETEFFLEARIAGALRQAVNLGIYDQDTADRIQSNVNTALNSGNTLYPSTELANLQEAIKAITDAQQSTSGGGQTGEPESYEVLVPDFTIDARDISEDGREEGFAESRASSTAFSSDDPNAPFNARVPLPDNTSGGGQTGEPESYEVLVPDSTIDARDISEDGREEGFAESRASGTAFSSDTPSRPLNEREPAPIALRKELLFELLGFDPETPSVGGTPFVPIIPFGEVEEEDSGPPATGQTDPPATYESTTTRLFPSEDSREERYADIVYSSDTQTQPLNERRDEAAEFDFLILERAIKELRDSLVDDEPESETPDAGFGSDFSEYGGDEQPGFSIPDFGRGLDTIQEDIERAQETFAEYTDKAFNDIELIVARLEEIQDTPTEIPMYVSVNTSELDELEARGRSGDADGVNYTLISDIPNTSEVDRRGEPR